jgi:hypothetical protein
LLTDTTTVIQTVRRLLFAMRAANRGGLDAPFRLRTSYDSGIAAGAAIATVREVRRIRLLRQPTAPLRSCLLRSTTRVLLLAGQIAGVPAFSLHDLSTSGGESDMTAKAVQILARHELSAVEVDQPEDRLYDHNLRATGRHYGKMAGLRGRECAGDQIAAIVGYT